LRKRVIAAALLAAALITAGYVIGQIHGIAPSSAASTSQTHPATGTTPHWGFRDAGGPHAAGQVTAINGTTITIKPEANHPGEQNTVTTVVLTSNTQYLTPGTTIGSSKDSIKVGSFIVAEGTLSADGKKLTASRVVVLPNGGLPAVRKLGPHAAGQVTAINGNTITIKPGVGRGGVPGTVTTIVVTSSTHYLTGPDPSATKAAVKVGSYVIARGTLSSDGKTLTATHVVVLPSAPTFGPFHGFGMWRGQFRGFGDAGAESGSNA
jgi:hypothetical protein